MTVIDFDEARTRWKNRRGKSACARLDITERGGLQIVILGPHGEERGDEYTIADAKTAEETLRRLASKQREIVRALRQASCSHPEEKREPATRTRSSTCLACFTVLGPPIEPKYKRCRTWPPRLPTPKELLTDEEPPKDALDLFRAQHRPCRRRAGHDGRCNNSTRTWSSQ